MATVTIAQVQCDDSIAVNVVKDFLKARNVDTSGISTPAQAKTAMETELKKFIKQTVVVQRSIDDGAAAEATSQTTNNAAVVLI